MAATSTRSEFGQLLRQARRSRKMSQVELGAGRYTGSYISHLESGRRTPTPDVIDFLARRLGVSPLEWGAREHYDKTATLRAEEIAEPGAVEDLLVAERRIMGDVPRCVRNSPETRSVTGRRCTSSPRPSSPRPSSVRPPGSRRRSRVGRQREPTPSRGPSR